MGCSDQPKRLIDLADVPENQHHENISCETKKQHDDLLQQGKLLEKNIDNKIKAHTKELEYLRQYQ